MNQFPPSWFSKFLNSDDDKLDSHIIPSDKINDFTSILSVDVDGIGGNFNLEMASNCSTCKDYVEPVIEDFSGGVASLTFLCNSNIYLTLFYDVTLNFIQIFEEFIYPKGDPDAVSISKKDVDLLQPERYINDTIIDFYILYLKNKIQEKEKARFHFFNSFFFRKLVDMDKIIPNICDGKSAFLRVRKWTRKVKLFEKDYIFIPVNFNLHWSLIVICHPGEVVNVNDRELDKSLKIPCILHMDSVKGYHNNLKDIVQSYLWEEWKDKMKDTSGEDLSSKFLNIPFLSIAVPQQENSYDCGIFLLHYIELFLTEAPFNFNPLKLTKLSKFLNLDWFPPEEAYHKRTRIRELIFELRKNHDSHFLDNGDYQNLLEYNDNVNDGQCHLTNREASTYHFCPGIDMNSSFDASSMVFKEHFEQEAILETSLGQWQSFDSRSSNYCFNGLTFTTEEDVDFRDQLMYMSTPPNYQQETEISPHTSCSSHNSNDVEISNIMFFGNKNWYQDLSYQGTPTLQLNQVSDVVDNKVIDDDVQIIDNLKVDSLMERPAKKRRLMHPRCWE
ncbi:probable ubiquitin-like-specific protease 2B [Vicia villosa]|uniref:probable ubiquitin-like-specific protease 2B n=1 Tax=Vicia villosa TaxID=3911 RepID=UPI00273C3B4F|nr:probable ubiquitin-like-specific protease 2B [Vicia villosa]